MHVFIYNRLKSLLILTRKAHRQTDRERERDREKKYTKIILKEWKPFPGKTFKNDIEQWIHIPFYELA